MTFYLHSTPPAFPTPDTEHKVIDVSSATAAVATIAAADTPTEIIPADPTAIYGRRITIRNDSPTAKVAIALGATTIAEAIYTLDTEKSFFTADDWSEEGLSAIADTAGAPITINIVNYKVV